VERLMGRDKIIIVDVHSSFFGRLRMNVQIHIQNFEKNELNWTTLDD
jgi:hypothetical protein